MRDRIPRTALRACSLAGVVVLALGSALGVPSRTQVLPSGSDDLASLVLGQDADRRAAAAERLVEVSSDESAASAIGRIVTSGDPDARRAMLAAIARAPRAPAWLLGSLAAEARSAPAEVLPEFLGAMSSVRTLQSAEAILPYAADARPEPVRTSALAALSRLTGRDERSYRGWSEWLAQAATWPEGTWETELEASLARRADRAIEGQQVATARLLEATRRLHLATPPAKQGEFLAGLLKDPLPELRGLGFELVSRELAAGTRLDGQVGSALLPLLTAQDARTRERTALLVNQLVPEGAEAAVHAALSKESDPGAAAALLAAAARWPTDDQAAPGLRWLAGADAARAGAAQLLLAMVRAGNLDAASDRTRALDILRSRDPAGLSGAEVRLYAILGEDSDHDRIATLLEGKDAPLRLTAADVLAGEVQYLAPILEAATSDPLLFEVAARAVVLHGPDAISFRILAKLPTTAPDVRRRTLAWVARLMPAADVYEVSRDTDVDPGYEELVLSQLAFEDRVMAEGVDPDNARAFRLGLPRLARLRIDAGRYEAALAALTPLSELAGSDQTQDAVDARAEALLCLGRIDQATELAASSSAWLEAMERTDDPALLRKLVDAFNSQFTDLLPDEAVRLQSAAKRAGPQ